MVLSTLPPGTVAFEPTTESNVAVPAPAVGSVRLAGGVAALTGSAIEPGAPVTLVIVAVTFEPFAGDRR